MTEWLSDLRRAVRGLRAQRAFAVVSIVVLGLGIGANTAMFGTLHAALLQPLPYADPDRIIVAQCAFSGRINPICSHPDYLDYRDQAASLASLSIISGFTLKASVTGRGEPERITFAFVSADLFRTLGVSPVVGRPFTDEEGRAGGPDAALVTHGYWQRQLGGSPKVIGQTLTVNGRPLTIAGVMAPGFRFLWDVDAWVVAKPDGPYTGTRRFHNWLMIGRLKPGVDLAQAQREADVIFKRLEGAYPDSNRNKTAVLGRLQDVFGQVLRQPLFLLMGAVALLLLVTAANIAGLLLARGSARRAELAIRAALGASRGQLVRQLLSESLVLAGLGGLLGTAVAIWLNQLLPVALQLTRFGIPEPELSVPVLFFALGLSIATGVLFGLVPALRATSAPVAPALAGAGRTTDGRGTARLRSTLVAAQIAVSLVLLVGSGLLVRSFVRLSTRDMGFNPEQLLTAEVELPRATYEEPARRLQFARALLEATRSIPGVTRVGLASQLPLRNPGNNVAAWAADQPPANLATVPLAYLRLVTPGYFDALQIPIRAGRDLRDEDGPNAPPVVIISETMARGIFPGVNPIGRRLKVDLGQQQPEVEVVGVVGDACVSSPSDDPPRTMYFPLAQRPPTIIRLAIRTAGDPDAITRALRERIWQLDRDLPVERALSMARVAADSVAPQRLVALALSAFSGVALLLAAVGLYGVLAFHVAQRTREFGVRMAMGARFADVAGLVMRQGLVVVAIGTGVGLAVAIAGTRLLRDQLFQIEPSDPITFAAVVVFLGLVATVACLVPAWRAARVDPVIALRVE